MQESHLLWCILDYICHMCLQLNVYYASFISLIDPFSGWLYSYSKKLEQAEAYNLQMQIYIQYYLILFF